MQTRENKQKKIEALAAQLAVADALIVAENAGLTAAEMEALRASARACGGKAQVVKNTLARRALADGRFQALAAGLSGPLIYGTGADAAAVAKVFVDAAKANPKLIIRAGALPDQAVMSGREVNALAALPGREQLLAMLAAAMQAPIAAFARALAEVPASFARAVAAVRDKKDQ